MPAVRTLPDALADAAKSDAGYTFVGSGYEKRRSYREMCCASQRVASALRAQGLKRGDPVALVIGDSAQFLTALFGASLAGVTPASLSPPATTGDLPNYLDATAGILNACAARAVITTAELQPHLDTLRSSCPALRLVLPFERLSLLTSAVVMSVTASRILIGNKSHFVSSVLASSVIGTTRR